VRDDGSDSGTEAGAPRERFRAGFLAAVPFALAGGLLSASFAAVAIIGAGGSLGAALVAAALMNSCFLAMGIALAPSLPGGAVRRAAQGQAVVDASWAMALRPEGTFDRHFLFGATAPQYAAWALGTVVGVLGRGVIGNTDRFGLDAVFPAVFPAFFLALLMAEARHPWCVVSAAVTTALIRALL
jgi:predicted branched-subunit amino acid permease